MRTIFTSLLGFSLLLGVACSDGDPDNGGSAGASGSGTAGSGAAGSGQAGSGTAGSGAAGTTGSCVDPRTEPSLAPLTDAAGSGVWAGFQIDSGELFYGDLDGVYAQPIAGGARRTVLNQGVSMFKVMGDKVRVATATALREVPRAGGSATELNQLPLGHTAALLTPGGLVIHDQSFLEDEGTLSLLGYDGTAPSTIAAYTSKGGPPLHFAVLGDRLFFSAAPNNEQTKELMSVPLAGGTLAQVPVPSGLRFRGILGVVGSNLYAAAEDDFLKNTVMKIDAGGVVGSYVVNFGTAIRAVAAEGGVAIGGIEFLDLWKDGQAAGERVRCFEVGAGVSSPFPTIHDYAAAGKDVFFSIRTPEPNQNAIQRVTLP